MCASRPHQSPSKVTRKQAALRGGLFVFGTVVRRGSSRPNYEQRCIELAEQRAHYRHATISTEEVVMHDGREAGLAGREKPPQKPRGGILAGIVVLLWALTSAMWAEI